jgi:lipid-A-disaccharide synthase
MSPKKIFIVAGEPSGDLHGGHLVNELIKLNPSLEIMAWGGDRMQLAGATIVKHYRELAFMGFYEVIKNLRTILKNFALIKRQVKVFNPDLIILIDYPGFNLRLSKWLYKNHYKTYYYIAPQAWAWKENRVVQLKKYIYHLLVILPFEESFFSERGVRTTYVGHPLLDEIPQSQSNPSSDKKIALLPGSRKQEIEKNLPLMVQMVDRFPNFQFQIAGLRHIDIAFYQKFIPSSSVNILWNDTFSVLQNATVALVSSGTATLETALMSVPQVVCYKSSRLNYEIAKRIIKVPYISLVNLIMGRKVVEELIQDQFSEKPLEDAMHRLLDDHQRSSIQSDYQELRLLLGNQKASETAAKLILRGE